jgi:hypothetical protein
MSATNVPPPGWHPDPENPTSSMRWWDGTQWTAQVRPTNAGPDPVYAPPRPGGGAPWQNPGGAPWQNPGGGRRGGWWAGGRFPAGNSFSARNAASIRAIIFSVAYLVIAALTGFVLLGIVPVVMTFRAVSRREPLMPVAALASAVVVVVSVATLTHR